MIEKHDYRRFGNVLRINNNTYPEFRIFETSKIVFKLKDKKNVKVRDYVFQSRYFH